MDCSRKIKFLPKQVVSPLFMNRHPRDFKIKFFHQDALQLEMIKVRTIKFLRKTVDRVVNFPMVTVESADYLRDVRKEH